MRFFNIYKKAFTLVELLLAITIVAVIAALVVPAVVTKYQQAVLENTYNKYMATLIDTIERLPITEGVSSFDKTSLYVDADNLSQLTLTRLENSSEKFLRNNFKILRYCGNVYKGGDADNGLTKAFPDCLPESYIADSKGDGGSYNLGVLGKTCILNCDSEESSVYDEVTYSCAVIKGGAVLCVRPQIKFNKEYADAGQNQLYSVTGWIDVNGKRGPNTIGVDMRRFTIPYQQVSVGNKIAATTGSIATSDVNDYVYECDRTSVYQPLCCAGWHSGSDEVWNSLTSDVKEKCCNYILGEESKWTSGSRCCKLGLAAHAKIEECGLPIHPGEPTNPGDIPGEPIDPEIVIGEPFDPGTVKPFDPGIVPIKP